MDWIVCARCGTDVDVAAAMCPRCGADPRTGRGGSMQQSGPRVAPGWHRLVKYLAVSAALGLVIVLVLRLVGGLLTRSTGTDSYEAGVAIIGLLGLVVGIGVASGAGVSRRWSPGRGPGANPIVGLSMVTCGLVVLVVGFGFVSAPKAGSGRGALDAGATPTPIWAGYETNTSVTSVTATWTQPQIATPDTGYADASFWVGLGGQNDPRLAQIGTDGNGESGQAPAYVAWYEMYPKPSVDLDPNVMNVRPGDAMTASVTETGQGSFRLVLVNHTTHQRFAVTQTDLGIATTDGAVIAELPTSPYKPTLADFGSVTFTDCSVGGRPLGRFPLTMWEIYRDGTTQARTSDLGADNASFTVTRPVVALATSRSHTPTPTGGIQGVVVVTPSPGTEPSTGPIDEAPAPITPVAFKRQVAAEGLTLLRDLVWIARDGADGTISDAAFASVSDDGETDSITAETETAPTSLAALKRHWSVVAQAAYDLAEPSSGVVLDLRPARKSALALLHDLQAVAGSTGLCREVAADLQRGLWVRPETVVPTGPYQTIRFKVLNEHAASLVGHRYVIKGQVGELHDAGAGYYWPGFPHGLEPRIEMTVAMTDEGYGQWDDYVDVIADRALKRVHENDVVTIYGICLGWHKFKTEEGSYEMMPLIRARVVLRH